MVNDRNFQRTLETLCLPLVISMNGTYFGKQQWLTVELCYVQKYPESKWKFPKVTAKLIAGQSPILIDYGQPLFVLLSRDWPSVRTYVRTRLRIVRVG